MKKITLLLKNKKVRIGLIILGIVLLSVGLFFALTSKKEDKKIAEGKETKTFAHTNKDIIKEEEFEGLKFTNITLITNKGYTTFTATVTNTTSTDSTVESVSILLKDKKGKTVIPLLGYIGEGLKAGESKVITANAQGEFKNVVSKTITAYED